MNPHSPSPPFYLFLHIGRVSRFLLGYRGKGEVLGLHGLPKRDLLEAQVKLRDTYLSFQCIMVFFTTNITQSQLVFLMSW